MPAWEDRLRDIGASLMTLEINTIEKANMSTAKMPDVPLALHEIIDRYSCFLQDECGFVLNAPALTAAAARVDAFRQGQGQAAAGGAILADAEPPVDTALSNWTFPRNPASAADLTNGPETFEAMCWAALAAVDEMDEAQKPGVALSPDEAKKRALLRRIAANAKQLTRIVMVLMARPDGVGLYGRTATGTTMAMMAPERPRQEIDTDLMLTIRKVWDIGLEQVLFQTALQIDGDIMQRIAAEIAPEKRDFYAKLHHDAVETGVRQWSGLFGLAKSLIVDFGKILFGQPANGAH